MGKGASTNQFSMQKKRGWIMEVAIRIVSWNIDHDIDNMILGLRNAGLSNIFDKNSKERRSAKFAMEFYCEDINPMIQFDEVLYLTDQPIVKMFEEVPPKEMNRVIETLSKDSKLRKVLEQFVLDTSKKILRS